MLRTIFLSLLIALFAAPFAQSEEAPSGQEPDFSSMSKEEILASPPLEAGGTSARGLALGAKSLHARGARATRTAVYRADQCYGCRPTTQVSPRCGS